MKPEILNLADDSQSSDDARLVELGYKQLLNRCLGFLSSTGICIAVLSPITVFSDQFANGLGIGGPVVILGGWAIESIFTFFVALSFAEIISAYPSSGGPFLWTSSLSRNKSYGTFLAILTGNLNLLGQVSFTALINYANSQIILVFAKIYHPQFNGTPAHSIGIVALITVLQVVINLSGHRSLKFWAFMALILDLIGLPILSIFLLTRTSQTQHDPYILSEYYETSGLYNNKAYNSIIGLAGTQFVLLGYDANSHLAEEIKDVQTVAPRALLSAMLATIMTGILLIVAIIYSMSQVSLPLFINERLFISDIFSQKFTKGEAAVAFVFAILTTFLCSTFTMMTNSRMMYGFARDGGIPNYFDHVNPKTQLPQRTILLSAIFSFIICLSAFSDTLFTTVTNLSTITLSISYFIPVALTLIVPKCEYGRGLFSLHAFSQPIAAISVIWLTFLTVDFCLPVQSDTTIAKTFNYAGPAIILIFLATLLSYSFTKARWDRKEKETSIRKRDVQLERQRLSIIAETITTITVVESRERNLGFNEKSKV